MESLLCHYRRAHHRPVVRNRFANCSGLTVSLRRHVEAPGLVESGRLARGGALRYGFRLLLRDPDLLPAVEAKEIPRFLIFVLSAILSGPERRATTRNRIAHGARAMTWMQQFKN